MYKIVIEFRLAGEYKKFQTYLIIELYTVQIKYILYNYKVYKNNVDKPFEITGFGVLESDFYLMTRGQGFFSEIVSRKIKI